MVDDVFLAYPMMCDGCPYRDIEPSLKFEHCEKCKRKRELDLYKKLKYR